jgi:hypothetical protein
MKKVAGTKKLNLIANSKEIIALFNLNKMAALPANRCMPKEIKVLDKIMTIIIIIMTIIIIIIMSIMTAQKRTDLKTQIK